MLTRRIEEMGNLPGFANGSGAVERSGRSTFAKRRRSALMVAALGLAAAVVVVADGRRQREPVVVRHLRQ